MSKIKISNGIVHITPLDLKKIIISNLEISKKWENITPIARNEWICWIESAKKIETRIRRIDRAKTDLLNGKSRPCCWEGCSHR